MAKAQGVKASSKKRVVKVDSYGDAHITASFNNIIISLTNKQGQVISWSSAGKMGFRGSKKNTPYAAQMAAADAANASPAFLLNSPSLLDESSTSPLALASDFLS